MMDTPRTITNHLQRFFVALATTLFFSLPLVAQTQTYTLSGTVLDTRQETIVGGNAVLFTQQGKQVSGSTTDAEGNFRLRNLSPGSYALRVSFVGYKEYTTIIKIPYSGSLRIVLEEDSQLLNTVTVERRAADMTIKGDTVVFNADAYHVGQGAMLEDLIKRIPGAEVSSSGSITINGKSVDKILVEGKEFFSGDTKVATKNLPAEVVDKLELLDRSSEQSRMTGFDDGDEETVLNLTFKASHKTGLFGNLFAGYGTNNRYEANATINNFSGKNRLTFIAGSNNTNDRGSGELDTDGGGGFRRRGRPQQGIATSSSVAGDIAWSLLSNLDLEGNGRYGYTDRVAKSKKLTEQFRTNAASLFSQEKQDLRSFTHGLGSQLRLTYKIDSLTEHVFRPSVWWNKNYELGYNTTSTWEDQTNPISTAQTQYNASSNFLSLGGNLDVSRRLSSKGRVLSLGIRTRYNGNQSEGNYLASFSGLGAGSGIKQNRDLLQQDNNHTLSTTLRLSYVEPLTSRLFLQVLGEWKHNTREGDRQVFTLDASGQYTLLDPQYSSKFTSELDAYRGSLNLQYRTSGFDITAGLGLEPGKMTTQYLTRSWVNQQLFFVPNLRINLQSNKQTMWRLDYRGSTEMPSVSYMIPTVDPTDLLRITEGNSGLKPSFTHQIHSFFRSFNPTTRVAINLFMEANYELNGIASVVRYDNTTGQQHISYRNVDGNSSVRLFGMSSMPFFSSLLTLNAGLRGMFNHQNSYIVDAATSTEQLNKSDNWSVSPSLALSFAKGNLYLRLRGGLSFNTALNSLSSQAKRTAWDYESALEGSYDLPFGLKLENDILYQINQGYGTGYKKDSWLWNTALSYSFLKNKAATIRLKGYDLLNSETGISREVTALNVIDSRTNVLGRYFMVHFIYRFSSFGKGSSRSDFGERHFGGPPPR